MGDVLPPSHPSPSPISLQDSNQSDSGSYLQSDCRGPGMGQAVSNGLACCLQA